MQIETLKPSKKRNRHAHVRRYDSMNELVDNVKDTKHFDCVLNSFTPDWIGKSFTTKRQIIDATNGIDQKAMDAMIAFKTVLQENLPEPKTVKRLKRWDEANGDEFDNDRFRSGQEAWRKTSRERVSGVKSITLATMVGGSCSVETEDMMWTPAVALALCDLLENAGYSVKLIACEYAITAYENEDDCMNVTTLKQPEAALDESSMSVFASGWFFRSVLIGENYLGCIQANSKLKGTHGKPAYNISSFCEKEEIDNELTPQTGFYQLPSVYNLSDAMMCALVILKRIEADQN